MKQSWFATALLLSLFCTLAYAAQRHQVTLRGSQLSPATLDIKVGDSVVWTNADDRDHSIAAADGSFKSDNLPAGQSFQHTFTRAGIYPYACPYHPREKGVIKVSP
jgi:plastocyanin